MTQQLRAALHKCDKNIVQALFYAIYAVRKPFHNSDSAQLQTSLIPKRAMGRDANAFQNEAVNAWSIFRT